MQITKEGVGNAEFDIPIADKRFPFSELYHAIILRDRNTRAQYISDIDFLNQCIGFYSFMYICTKIFDVRTFIYVFSLFVENKLVILCDCAFATADIKIKFTYQINVKQIKEKNRNFLYSNDSY